MEIEFDPVKSALNEVRRGLPFDVVADFEWKNALVRSARDGDRGELRYTAVGRIGPRTFVLVFTMTPRAVRLISLRRANRKEVELYDRRR